LVVLHGYGGTGGTGEGTEAYFEFLPWTDQLGFLYVYPDGTVDEDGYPFWNATDACCDFFDTGVDDSGYLRSLIEAIIAELAVDVDRIYLFGYSNGGFMVYRMACDHADLIAAVASLAGATFANPGDCNPSAPVRALQLHGTEDINVPFNGGSIDDVPYPGAVETTEQWAIYNQCSTTPDSSHPPLDLDRFLPGFETTVARYSDDCSPGGSAELWTIVGADHFPALSMDFTPQVLNFFLSGGGENALLIYRHFIPAAAFAAGAEGAFFQTDIEVSNRGSTTGRYRFLWLPRGADIDNSEPAASGEFSLGSQMAVRYTNAVHEIFGLETDALGAIVIEANSRDLLFMSRTYNVDQTGDGGTFGQAIPAVAEPDMIPGRETCHILFATENGQYRTNIGCLNADRRLTRVDLELFDQQGTFLEEVQLRLDSWSNEQLNRTFADYAPVLGSVKFSSPLPYSSFFCYGSVLDNRTSDPTTVLPQ
jgi:polyhydroxybutyrate depolymerase